MGRPGRKCVAKALPELVERHAVNFIIANAENSAGGLGATVDVVRELRQMGVHALTLGNHAWAKKDLIGAIDGFDFVVRPLNFARGLPGRGAAVMKAPNGVSVGVVNAVGRVYMEPHAVCPFEATREAVVRLRDETPVILVDFHAEATAEKQALGRYLDGRCSAVVGTHTHVPTADEQILPAGTAYISDVGMTGPTDSIIGVEIERAVGRFLTGLPAPYKVAAGPNALQGVVIDIDETSGRSRSIERVRFVDPTVARGEE